MVPFGQGTQVLRTPAAHVLEMGRHHSRLRTAGRAQDAHCGARGYYHTPLGESTSRNYCYSTQQYADPLLPLLIGYVKLKRSSRTKMGEDEVPNPCAVLASVVFHQTGNDNDNDNDKTLSSS